jgi:hypothetical protein
MSMGAGADFARNPATAGIGGTTGDLETHWYKFCDGLRLAGHETLTAARNPADAAEGLLQLGLLLEQALRWYLRGADPDQPRFIEINDTPEVADNLFAAVRGDAVYRVTGNVSTLFDINLSVHSSWVWLKPTLPSGDAGLADLKVGPDGSLELILGGERREGNWMPLPPEAQFIQLREYHADYASHRPGIWDIEKIDAEDRHTARQGPDEVAEAFAGALSWAEKYGSFHRASIRSGRTFPETPNTMNRPAPNKGGNSHIWYGFGRFGLAEDEALVLEFARPEARLWSVQWLTDPWYENPDLLGRLTGITGAEAHVDDDGRVRVVLSGRDPGIHNWLDTTGYPEGLFVTRWIWCDDGPETTLTVVPLARLGEHLPASTPKVGRPDRQRQIARRRKHFVHRRR